MEPVVQLEDVRRVVVHTLGELGGEGVDAAAISETTLMSDPSRSGRRFQYGDLRAVWFSDRDTVEFFSADGEYLRSVAIPKGPHSAQAAA